MKRLSKRDSEALWRLYRGAMQFFKIANDQKNQSSELQEALDDVQCGMDDACNPFLIEDIVALLEATVDQRCHAEVFEKQSEWCLLEEGARCHCCGECEDFKRK